MHSLEMGSFGWIGVKWISWRLEISIKIFGIQRSYSSSKMGPIKTRSLNKVYSFYAILKAHAMTNGAPCKNTNKQK